MHCVHEPPYIEPSKLLDHNTTLYYLLMCLDKKYLPIALPVLCCVLVTLTLIQFECSYESFRNSCRSHISFCPGVLNILVEMEPKSKTTHERQYKDVYNFLLVCCVAYWSYSWYGALSNQYLACAFCWWDWALVFVPLGSATLTVIPLWDLNPVNTNFQHKLMGMMFVVHANKYGRAVKLPVCNVVLLYVPGDF